MIQIKMYGLGGQGVVTAARILVEAVVVEEGRYARSLPAYGHERRGAPIHADVIVDDGPILLNTFVYHPDIVVVFDPAVAARGVDIHAGAPPGALLVINTPSAWDAHSAPPGLLDGFACSYQVDATGVAMEHIHRNIPNSAMLGALCRAGAAGLEPVLTAIERYFGPRAGQANACAARAAYERTQAYETTSGARSHAGRR